MKVILDENVVRQIAEQLRLDGHAVLRVREIARGSKDSIVLDLAHQESALLLTGDKDFGELVFRQHQQTLGVVLTRLEGLPHEEKARIVSQVFPMYGEKLLSPLRLLRKGACASAVLQYSDAS